MVAGLSESEREAILERYMADVAMQQEAREQERRRQREMLEVSWLNNTANQQFSFLSYHSETASICFSTLGPSRDFRLNFALINSDLTIYNN